MTWFILRNIFFLVFFGYSSNIFMCIVRHCKKNWSQNTYRYIYVCIYIFKCSFIFFMIKNHFNIFEASINSWLHKNGSFKIHFSLCLSCYILLYSSIPSITFPFHDKNDFESNHKIHIKHEILLDYGKLSLFPFSYSIVILFFLCVSLLGGHIKLMSRKTKIWWV